MVACEAGNAKVTRLLLQRGAETVQRDAVRTGIVTTTTLLWCGPANTCFCRVYRKATRLSQLRFAVGARTV